MPVGFNNITSVTMTNITDLANITTPNDFFVNVSNIVYGGVLWFIILWILWVILVMVAQKVRDQPLNNAMYSGAACSVLAFLMYGLQWLSGHYLWVFPLITIFLALAVYATKS